MRDSKHIALPQSGAASPAQAGGLPHHATVRKSESYCKLARAGKKTDRHDCRSRVQRASVLESCRCAQDSRASPAVRGISTTSKEHLRIQRKSISDTRVSDQVTGIARVSFDLLPYLIHEDVQIFDFISVVRSPNGL